MEEPTVVAEETVEEVVEEIAEPTWMVEGDPEPIEEPEEEIIEEPPKKQTAQERINEITKARRKAEREARAKAEEAEYWRKEALKGKEPEQRPISDGRPRQEQFDTVEEYEDALFDWRDKKRSAEQREKAEKEAVSKALNAFNKNASKVREEHDDFDEVMETPVFSDTMRKTLLTLDNGPEIAYHIGTHPEIADSMLTLSPERQVYEIAKLEREILLAKKTKKISNAPPPVEPVGGMTSEAKDPSKLTIEEWMALENKKRLEKIQKNLGG